MSAWQTLGSDAVFDESFFPPRLERPLPEWFADLPEGLEEVLWETYHAYYSEHRYLTAVGIRTALDLALVDKIGDKGGFQQKVQLLRQSGFVGDEEARLMATALEVGNAAAHRGFRPEMRDLDVLLDITESVVHGLFIKADRLSALREAADRLHQNTPARQKGGDGA
jgi:hypothetical protein